MKKHKAARRLQGKDFARFRANHRLTLLCISKSASGNYRADMLDENGKHHCHWLNDSEKAGLISSGYLDSHECYGKDFISSGELTKRIRLKRHDIISNK